MEPTQRKSRCVGHAWDFLHLSKAVQPEVPQNELVPRPEPISSGPPAAPSRLAWIFRGPNGVRAGWRLLIFAAIIFAFQFAVVHVLHHRPGMQQFTPSIVAIQEAIALAIVVIASLIMARFERRSLGIYGLPARGAFGSRFFEGLVWGFAAESAIMLILRATGNASFNGFDQHGMSALKAGVLWGIAFLLVGLFEEFLFRGYPQFTLASGIGFWPAAVIISGLFWFSHMFNGGETWVGGLATAVVAMLFCLSLWLTGNLWFAIGMHAAWDWTETYFFGVPDSGMPAKGHLLNSSLSGSKWMTGGTVGPEASVVTLLLLLVLMVLIYLRFRKSAVRPYQV